MNIVSVSSKSQTNSLANIIVDSIEEGITFKCIGAGAVNQAIKGIAVAEVRLQNSLICKPSFFNVILDEKEKSGISLEVKKEEI